MPTVCIASGKTSTWMKRDCGCWNGWIKSTQDPVKQKGSRQPDADFMSQIQVKS